MIPSDSQKSILFVNQHYFPDVAATGQKLTDLAEYLADMGHHVSVFCSRGQYVSGVLQTPLEEVRNGVRIYRTKTGGHGRESIFWRLFDYLMFYLRVFSYILFSRRRDFVVYLTTPPLLSFLGGFLKKIKGQRYGVWSMDLHPEAEEVLGMLNPSGWTARLLHAFNNFGYKNADFVVDLGVFMQQRLLDKGLIKEKLHTISLWDKPEEFEPISKEDNPLIQELGLQGKFVVMYSGNAGLAHRFDELLATMEALNNHPRIFFLFVGNGPQRQSIEYFATQTNINNYRYLDYFPREQLRYSLSLADLHVLTLKNEMVGVAVPSKLYGIMAAGKPVLMIGPEASEPGCVILEEDAGVVIDPYRHAGKTTELITKSLLFLEKRQDKCWQLGLNSRRAFTEKYTQYVGCSAWHKLFEEIDYKEVLFAE